MKLEDVEIKNSVLIIVDVQNDFFHEKGGMGSKNISVEHGKNDVFEVQTIVPKIVNIISHARSFQVPVIFIQSLYSEWTDSPSFKKRGLTGGADYRRHCRPGTWGSKFYRVKPQPDDYVVTKHRHSAFIDTDLELVLRSRGIKTIILTGIATNVCVESTARDGFMKDYYVVLVEDCCAAWSQREHESAIFNIETYFGAVTSSKEVVKAWETMTSTPQT